MHYILDTYGGPKFQTNRKERREERFPEKIAFPGFLDDIRLVDVAYNMIILSWVNTIKVKVIVFTHDIIILVVL